MSWRESCRRCVTENTAVLRRTYTSTRTRLLRSSFILKRNLVSSSAHYNKIIRNNELPKLSSQGIQNVTIAGNVRSIRKQKKVAFAHVSDGTTLEPIQAIFQPELAKDITNGSYVQLSGQWQKSPGKGQAFELQVEKVEHVGECNPEVYPIQKKSQTPDFLRSLPHLRLRTPFYSLLARARSQLIADVHDFYNRGRLAGPAVQVQSPLITSSDCEGAGEVFTISPKSGVVVSGASEEPQQLYFRDPKYLTVSAQLHLEAYAAELGDVWTLSPTFRAEESDTPRHLSEFYMLEAEFRGVASLKQLMDEVEQLIKHVIGAFARSPAGEDLVTYYSDLKYSQPEREVEPSVETRWAQAMTPQWQVVSYADAIKHLEAHHATHPDSFVHVPNINTGLQLEHERHLVSHVANNTPLFVTDYPKHIKPFYMLPSKLASDGILSGSANDSKGEDTVACFDLLFPFGTAELVGGSLREHRLPNLIESMREKGLIKQQQQQNQARTSDSISSPPLSPSSSIDVEHEQPQIQSNEYPHLQPGETLGSLQWYADLRRFGTSPHGGFGMGFDRLLAYVAGVNNVRDTVGFPRYFGRADC